MRLTTFKRLASYSFDVHAVKLRKIPVNIYCDLVLFLAL